MSLSIFVRKNPGKVIGKTGKITKFLMTSNNYKKKKFNFGTVKSKNKKFKEFKLAL